MNNEHYSTLLDLTLRIFIDSLYLGRFNADPSCAHGGDVKRTLRYLRYTQHHGELDRNRGLIGYCDSDWAGDPHTRRSATG